MHRLRRCILMLVIAAGPLAFGTPAVVEETLARARAYLGEDRVLDGVTSLRYAGRIESEDRSEEKPRLVTGSIELVFQKPAQQRITQVVGTRKDIIGSDGSEAWQRREEADNPLRAQMGIMNVHQIRRIRAETLENLHFYRGLEARGGRLEFRGELRFEGVDAVRIAFVYPDIVTFVRTFDKKTGRLLLTESDNGTLVREEGERIVDGIRFPLRLISRAKNLAGETVTTTIYFDQITVNGKFAPELFATPPAGR